MSDFATRASARPVGVEDPVDEEAGRRHPSDAVEHPEVGGVRDGGTNDWHRESRSPR